MKLVLDEKLKHRLIGIAVLVSLGAIFAPAVMKKSSQRLENSFSVHVKLPPKPLAPDVVISDEKELFKTIKVAQAELPAVNVKRQLAEQVKAEQIRSDIAQINIPVASPVEVALKEASQHGVKKTSALVNRPVTQPTRVAVQKKAVKRAAAVIKPQIARPRIASKDRYAVQLASFSQVTNAQSLVSRLRSKGYKANFIKSPSRQGMVYKVYVGSSPRKQDMIKLRTQLATVMQLNGFVVNTGVS
jgi:DedD protein